jgi:hypothetical protein
MIGMMLRKEILVTCRLTVQLMKCALGVVNMRTTGGTNTIRNKRAIDEVRQLLRSSDRLRIRMAFVVIFVMRVMATRFGTWIR